MISAAALILLSAVASEDPGTRRVVVPPASTSSAGATGTEDRREPTSEVDLRLREPRITAAQRQTGMALELTLGATVLPGIGSFVVEDPIKGSIFLVSGLGFRALAAIGLANYALEEPGGEAMLVTGLVGTGVVLISSLINVAAHGRSAEPPAWAR